MALDSTQITVAGTGAVYTCDAAGASLPTSASGTPSGYTEMGYTTEAGVVFHVGMTSVDIKAWQSFYPVRTMVTERDANVKFTLLQWNADTFDLAFGAGGAAGEPGLEGTLDNRSLVIDIEDGGDVSRLVIENGMVSDVDDINFTKGAAADLGITFKVLGTDGTVPWYFTSDSAILSAAS